MLVPTPKCLSDDESLINYEEEKREEEKYFSLYKCETNMYIQISVCDKMWCGTMCRAMLGKHFTK